MPFVTVTKAEFAKLRGHHLDALRYLSGGRWGWREGPVEVRREATWASLAANPDARDVRVRALLWARAREVGSRWSVGQLEPFKDAVRREIEEGDTAQHRPPPGEPSGGAMANDAEMDVDETPLALRQRRLRNAAPSEPQASVPPPREALGGCNEDLGAQHQSTGREMLQQLRGELRRLAPALERAVGALAAVQRSIADDQTAGVDSATVRHAGKVDGALDVLKGVLAGMSAEKLRVALSHAETAKQTASRAPEDGRRAAMGRSWRDVAASPPPVRRAPLQWDAGRTVILRPTDESWARKSFPTYAFGEAFRGLFPMGGEADAQFRIERVVRLSTGAVKALVSEAAFEQLRGASGTPFSVAPFGEWTVSGGAPSPGRSVVVAGVPEHLTEQQVAEELVEGTARDLPEAARVRLSTLRVQRLAKRVRDEGRRPDGNPAPPGAREVRDRRAPEFVASRCCRIFADNELIDLLLARGYLNLRWAVLPVRQYNPPTFYCAKCKRRGSHSTRFHRDLNHDHDG